MKFSIKDFFSKCYQIHKKLPILIDNSEHILHVFLDFPLPTLSIYLFYGMYLFQLIQ